MEEKVIPFDSLEINYNVSSCVNEAYNIGRVGNIFQNNFDILNLFFKPKSISLTLDFDETELNNIVESISSSIPNPLIQSDYYVENDILVITKGADGNVLDLDEFKLGLYDVLNNLQSTSNNVVIPIKNVNYMLKGINIGGKNRLEYLDVCKTPQNAYYEKDPLKIYPEIVGISFDKNKATEELKKNQSEYEINLLYTFPEITLNDLDINIFQNKLSTFSTQYNTSNANRTTNLKLAADKINGFVLAPGEDFSYNKVVGSRTIEAGYKEAKIYSNGEVVDGIGGGICQISSTLYNSVVLANLEIVERHNHQFLTSYVSAGRDATVSYGAKDLKFKNTRSYPIKINLSVENGIVDCSIYGIKEENEYDIEIEAETLSFTEPSIKYEQDDSLGFGVEKVLQRGSNGTTVNVFKIIKLNGSIVSKELLSQDKYNSLEKIIVKNSNY